MLHKYFLNFYPTRQQPYIGKEPWTSWTWVERSTDEKFIPKRLNEKSDRIKFILICFTFWPSTLIPIAIAECTQREKVFIIIKQFGWMNLIFSFFTRMTMTFLCIRVINKRIIMSKNSANIDEIYNRTYCSYTTRYYTVGESLELTAGGNGLWSLVSPHAWLWFLVHQSN